MNFVQNQSFNISELISYEIIKWNKKATNIILRSKNLFNTL
jgi:hypothetical protein